jgi:hypothetical protein
MKLTPDKAPVVTDFRGIDLDLNRHLDLPYGSLTPGCNPEPRWRIESRQTAEEFSWATIGAMAGWLLGFAALIAVALLLWA